MTFDCPNTSLKQGSKGSKVRELQTALKQLDFYKASVDGDYGNLTYQAVKNFQKATGHSQDGWFGPKTCKSLNTKLGATSNAENKSSAILSFNCPTVNLKKGSTGELVTKLQTMLKALGYYTRQIDGSFGTYTEQAVKNFQKAVGHPDSGEFGPKTCPVLNKAYQNKVSTKKTAQNKVVTTSKKTKSTEIIIDAKKYNFLNASQANCTIEGIHFLISQVDDTNSFKVKPWKTLELMGGKIQHYKAHRQPLQYKLITFIDEADYQKVKNALILLQEKKECNVIYKSIESGKYYITINRSYQMINLWKITIDLTEVMT